MRTLLLLSSSGLAMGLFAQCPFTPTITPTDLMLCPNETAELTTQVYDAYQWYRGGEAIDGATAQIFPVEQFADAGYSFTVEATLDGCTELSEPVLVDGHAFLDLTIMNDGDLSRGPGPNGEQFFCVGDTAILRIGRPYTTNITWYDDGEPIPGETSTTLTVTAGGAYSATASPGFCPDFVGYFLGDLVMAFGQVTRPEIGWNGALLCALPPGTEHQWYLDGEPLPNSNSPCIEPVGLGSYTVFAYTGSVCAMVSEPYLATSVEGSSAPTFEVGPVPASDVLRIHCSGQPPSSTWNVLDLTGRAVAQGRFTSDRLDLDVRNLAAGKYWFCTATRGTYRPVAFTVAH